MNLYVSIERDETLRFVLRAYREHRLVAEATLPKCALSELLDSPLSSRQCRIAIAANQQALATIIIRKASVGNTSATLRSERGCRFVQLSLDDLLGSGERFSPGPLPAGAIQGRPLYRTEPALPQVAAE